MTPLAYAVAAGLGNVVGALAVVRHLRRGLRAIDACLAFGAGFMLAVSVLGVLPEAFQATPLAPLCVLLGYFGVHLTQHVFTPHFHFGEETHRLSPSAGHTALLGLTLHTFFDGVAIASGFAVSQPLGLLVFFAILLHKLPEGLAISSLFLASGESRGAALAASGALAVSSMIGALLTQQLPILQLYGLPLAAGVTLYVGASNLVPEFQGKKGWSLPVSFFIGCALFYTARRLTGG